MGLLRFLGLLFVLVSIFAGTAAMVAVLILAVRFWPLLLVIVLALVIFQYTIGRLNGFRT
ncbi:hypothetical protein [Pseudomonas aeruginosa]|uniref:hypothetical protein n=1 Tax=Pseudomonas aeruginosa TaxID=287 RepID=UPI00071BE1EB|nr:hypothetical protein [Pseudomonas aeruginosa]KSC58719.1 hypothetical protein AO887_10475 [Pseudomonas aeruginosa]MDP5489722.1 hypothetical protein [Pseudomonas aeruginosa]MDV7939344.1 hypothetical protein [Pseudomonas aeruginosa]HEC1605871.1 hypothetical protein [Pseudomonas aeruginosa]